MKVQFCLTAFCVAHSSLPLAQSSLQAPPSPSCGTGSTTTNTKSPQPRFIIPLTHAA
jgi:hypothetical protein